MAINYRDAGRAVTVSAAIPSGNTQVPVNWQMLLEWETDHPVALDLQIDVRLVVSAGGGFPEVLPVNFCAGSNYTLGVPPSVWDKSPDGCVVLKIECGAGPDPRVLYADARSGRYSLGSQKWVRVSVARYLALGASDAIVRGSVAPSDGSGDYLTYSAAIDVAPGVTVAVPIVAGALWFEFYPEEDGEFEAASTDSTVNWRASRSVISGAPVYMPPSSPLPLLGSNGISLTNIGAADSGVYVCMWIR